MRYVNDIKSVWQLLVRENEISLHNAPFLCCLAKKLIGISGDHREGQWLHQRLYLAVVRENTASILAWVQVWYDFSHPQCINQCSCPSLASLQWIAIAFRMSVFSMSFVLSMFFLCFLYNPLCSIVKLPSSAILTNITLFIFQVPNTAVLLFTDKPFCNLSLPLSVQHHLGCYVPGGTHTQWRYSIMVCTILLFSFLLDIFVYIFYFLTRQHVTENSGMLALRICAP